MILMIAFSFDHGLKNDREVHIENLKQLTFGEENAEAYFSYDGKRNLVRPSRMEIFILQILHHLSILRWQEDNLFIKYA